MLKRLMSFLIFFGLFSASYAESDEVLPTNYPPFIGINHTEYGTGVYGSSNNTPWNGFIGMTSAGSNTVTTSANCSADPLLYEGQAQNSGTYYFQAQWSPNHYDVEYNSGSCGGTGITDAGAATYGEAYQIKGLGTQNSGVTEPEGYKFTGWVGTSEGLYNGSDTPYSNLAEGRRKYAETGTVSPYLIEGDLLLTALCEAIPYNIKYDCDCNITGECSGNAPTDNNSHYVTDNVTVLANPGNNGCAWNEHEFQGWNCTADSDNSSVSDSNDYPNQVIANWPASNVTCRAKWSGEQHHIYYSCGSYGPNSVSVDGTLPTDSTLYYTGTTQYELAQNATGCTVPNGYHFTGWNCDKNIDDGDGQAQYNVDEQTGRVSQSGIYNVNGDTNCVAMWENNQIKLIWQGGASGVTMPNGLSSSCFYESGTINVRKPTRPGYTFVGWKVIGHCDDGDECPPTWQTE